MAVKLYMNHHVPKAITIGLRLREVDVITAYEDKSHELDDSLLLDRANELQRVLFSQDDDLLAEATKRQKEGVIFRGVVYSHQLRVSISTCIRDLEIIAKAGEPEDFINRVQFLPL
jgi:hypothetical protein